MGVLVVGLDAGDGLLGVQWMSDLEMAVLTSDQSAAWS